MHGLAELLAELGAETAPGAAQADLAAFEGATGLRLPPALRALYAASDGAALGGGRLHLLPLAAVREYLDAMRDIGIPTRWGYFPFTDNDSDPFCVCCRSPLAGTVVQVFHDDNAALKFRDLESGLRALAHSVGAGGRGLSGMPSQFAGAARTADDISMGRELLRLAPGLEEVERGDAFRFGMWLLSEEQVGEIVAALQTGDEYVRGDGLARLAALDTPDARAAARESGADLARFVARCADALRRAGVEAAVVGGTDLRAGPRGAGVNTAMFYARRREPDVFERLIARFRDA